MDNSINATSFYKYQDILDILLIVKYRIKRT